MTTGGALPARLYLWIWGSMLIVLGVGSLVLNPNFAVGDGVTTEYLFGVFETNGWHGLAGLVTGLTSFAFAAYRGMERMGAAAVGGVNVATSLVFLFSGDGTNALGLIPVDMADNLLLHLLPGVVGLLCAAVTPRGRVSAQRA